MKFFEVEKFYKKVLEGALRAPFITEINNKMTTIMGLSQNKTILQ